MGQMTDRKQKFILEYLRDFNATRAAIRAGFKKKSARQCGCILKKDPQVQKAINKRKAEIAEETKIHFKDILFELQRYAFAEHPMAYDDVRTFERIESLAKLLKIILPGKTADDNTKNIESLQNTISKYIDRVKARQ